MHRIFKVLTAALIVLVLAAPAFCAEPVKGEVVAIEGGTYTVKDYDGKVYKITEELAVGLNLQTGDVVEIELEQAQPAKVKKVEKKK